MAFVGSMAKWYVANLKAHPLLTNVASGAVLMTAGDVLAQESESNSHEKPPAKGEHLHMKRYGTHGPALISSNSNNSDEPRAVVSQQRTIGTSSTATTNSILQAIQDEFWFWDPFRTATMAAWSIVVYTPFHVALYSFYNRYLPKQNLVSISSRVAMSFMCSIPLNAAFYVYGTTVHHTTEWLALRRELEYELIDMGCTNKDADEMAKTVPFRWDELFVKCQRKIECELQNTVITSGSCWIPINFFTFTMVPTHLRPLSLMFFSVFWNCYLSLSQHRDISIPTEEGSS